MTERFDVVVIGAGMAGASLAAAIAPAFGDRALAETLSPARYR